MKRTVPGLSFWRAVLVFAACCALPAATLVGVTASQASAAATPVCDATGSWFAAFTGTRPFGNGSSIITISHQHVVGNHDDLQGDDGDDNQYDPADPPLPDQDDFGSGPGQASIFSWQTTFPASNGATASGIGVIFVPTNPLFSPQFALTGHGTHPVYGQVTIRAEGDAVCSGGQGTAADGTIQVKFEGGSTDNGTITASRGEGP